MTVSVDLLNGPQVARQLASIAPAIRRNTSRAIVSEAQPIVAEGRANASWSSRIPGAITATVRYSGRQTGVLLRVNSAKAPHARNYEAADGRRTEVRFPIYGVWRAGVKYPATRPFIAPAIRSGAPRVRAGIERAIGDALRV